VVVWSGIAAYARLTVAAVVLSSNAAVARPLPDCSECDDLVSSPPFDDRLFENDGDGYGAFNSDRLGAAFLGVA